MSENAFDPLAMFAADAHGRVRYRVPLVTYANAFEEAVSTVWMSPQVEAVTGYRPSEWIEERGFFERIVHPDDRRAVLEEVRRSRSRLEPFSRDYRLRARDGRTVWVHDESVPVLGSEGAPEFIQGYFVDITERKSLETALAHAQKNEALGRLAAGIAHDFNNILTAVSGYAGAAAAALDDPQRARDLLDEIRAVVDRAVRLTRQLLAFSRRQELTIEEVDLVETVRGIESMLLHLAGPAVEVDFELCGAAVVKADRGQLEQVLMNLVANGRDAVGAGGRLTISTERVQVAAPEADRLRIAPGEYAALVVSDDGAGMSADVLARVFDPFFTTKERGAGTGLGLSTVHGIVRQSGGAVDVSSSVGGGSTFRILLALADVG
jgi:PAS domain S-box-containing protein